MQNKITRIKVQPGEFREAYLALQKIVPISKHTYSADPADNLIRIEYADCPELESPEYMLWKMRYCQ
jgi:hypothetical protein